MLTENKLQALLMRLAKINKIFAIKTVGIGGRGFPDVTMIHKGAVTFIELKTEKGRLSPHQVAMHRRIIAAGGRVLVLTGAGEVINFIDQLTAAGCEQ